MRRSTLGILCTAAGLAFAALLAAPGSAQAQNAVVRGTVRSDNGEAVVGANVYVLELGVQAATNEAGRYVLTVPGDRVRGQQLQLRVRAIGYRPSSRPITLSVGEQTVDFALAADINRLDEIVVTGVLEGTEKSRLPFTVSTVDAADVPVPPTDPLRMLTGRVPGAQIVSGTGRPGSAPSVILRGPTSINASGRSQEPLYIVDGLMINGDLPQINPADIENIEVVKGAAASSLYGARAGNGVITITTRSGRRAADGMSFNLRAETGGNDIEKEFPSAQNTALLFDPTGTRMCIGTTAVCTSTVDWNTEAARVNNAAGDFALSPSTFPLDPGAATTASALRVAYLSNHWPGRVYDIPRSMVTSQPFFNGTFDMTGRFNNTTVFASASNLNQAGSIRYLQGFQRYSGRVNVDQRIGSNWTASLRTYYSRNAQDGLNYAGGQTGAFFVLTRQRAIENLLALDTLKRLYIRSDIQGGGSQNSNPLYDFQNNRDRATVDRMLGGITLRYTPARWLDLEGNLSYDYQGYEERQFRDKGYRTTSSSGTNTGFVFMENTRSQSMNGSLNATFRANLTRDIASTWTLRALFDQQDVNDRQESGNTLAIVGIPQLGNATQSSFLQGSSFTTVRDEAFFAGGRLDFFNGRYGADGLVRRDGSSLFGSDNRWQNFGRFSGYWNLAQEPWWFAPHTLSSFKLRGSHGTAGGRPNFSAQYETFSVNAGFPNFSVLGNTNLRPEITTDNEVGADIEFFRRALLTITYDKSRTENQILQVPIGGDLGFTSRWANAGTISNRSWELSLNLPVVQRRNVSWSWTFAYDHIRTVIDELTVPPFFYGATIQGSGAIFLAQPGEPYAMMWSRKFVTDCSELNLSPWGGKDFSTDCGGPGASFQRNNDGYIVWAGGNVNSPNTNPWTYKDGLTHNLYMDSLRALDAPWGVSLNFGMPILVRDTSFAITNPSLLNGASARNMPLGSGLPSWQFSIGQSFQYRRLSVYALFQGVIGRYVWNEGRHWAHLDFNSGDVDQAGVSPELAKPIGYYWRAKAPDQVGIGGFYDLLQPNNYTVERASYGKLRELSVSYNIGPVSGVGNWTASLIGRNLFTITNYMGWDPEVGASGGLGNSRAINAVDGFNFPNTRSFTFALQTSF